MTIFPQKLEPGPKIFGVNILILNLKYKIYILNFGIFKTHDRSLLTNLHNFKVSTNHMECRIKKENIIQCAKN